MRPRIVVERIEQSRKFGEQRLVGALQLSAPMQRWGQQVAFFIEGDVSQNRVRSRVDRGEIGRDPVRGYSTVRVGCQDDAVAYALLAEPSLRDIHCAAPRAARVSLGRRQGRLDDAEWEGEFSSERSREVRAPVTAIVGE